MGLFDKLKERVADKVAEQAAKQSAAAAKLAARKSAEAAIAVAKGAGNRLQDALFGAPPSPEEVKKRKQEEIGEQLRAADRRVKEREAERARAEKEVEDELAALKEKVNKR